MIIDTNALSAIIEGESALKPVLLEASALELPVVVLGEFVYGIQASRYRKKYEAWLEHHLSAYQILHVTEITAQFYGNVKRELKLAGTPIPENDVWIAALCREHRMSLLTRDTHFEKVKALRTVSW